MRRIVGYGTRGWLYGISLYELPDGTYMIEETKRGEMQGRACLGNADLAAAQEELARRIEDSAKYDSIFYTRKVS